MNAVLRTGAGDAGAITTGGTPVTTFVPADITAFAELVEVTGGGEEKTLGGAFTGEAGDAADIGVGSGGAGKLGMGGAGVDGIGGGIETFEETFEVTFDEGKLDKG